MSRTVKVNPLTVLVSVLIAVELFGLLGRAARHPRRRRDLQVVARDLYDDRTRRAQGPGPRSASTRSRCPDGSRHTRAMATETIEVAGHIVDSLILPKILDLDRRGRRRLPPRRRRHRSHQPRPEPGRDRARRTTTRPMIDALCERLAVHGASRVSDARRRAGRGRPRRRAAGRVPLDDQPGHRRAHRRPLGAGGEPGDGLRPRGLDDGADGAHRADAPGASPATASSSATPACGCTRRSATATSAPSSS